MWMGGDHDLELGAPWTHDAGGVQIVDELLELRRTDRVDDDHAPLPALVRGEDHQLAIAVPDVQGDVDEGVGLDRGEQAAGRAQPCGGKVRCGHQPAPSLSSPVRSGSSSTLTGAVSATATWTFANTRA
jgi:hypothetical protein